MTGEATVLLVDDDEAVRRVFDRLLRAAGFRVLLAKDGQAGLATLRETTPDAVLLDLNMPGLSGLDVLAQATGEMPETPFIVISGSGIIEDVVQAIRRGAWDYVTKPVEDSHLLIQAVRRALEKSSLLRENREQRARLERLNRQLTEVVHELRTDQEAGRRVQFQLLPADGLSCGDYAFSRRLYPSQYLSGDFVDYFAIGEHHVGMYMADVSGHGAASAFVTAMLAALIGRYREAVAGGENDVMLAPDRLLERLNHDLDLRKMHKHLTMFYAVLDLRTHLLSFSSAGQYPFPLISDGEQVHVLECSGRPLGVFADARFSRREISLAGARRMLLLSDGILELLPSSPDPSKHKLDELKKRLLAGADIEHLVPGMDVEGGVHCRDDVTLLLIERTPA
jgi:sigma-B regulation protein RsbU (phosphoserine phosphatase)